jgi:GxxExxY protein
MLPLLPLHHAQLISYLKGFDKPLGILANFGARSVEHATYPNKTDQKTPLTDHFDFEKICLQGKDDIKDLLVMANRILVTLGAGYFHQIYRRAFYWELKQSGVSFETAGKVVATYKNQRLGEKEVNFLIVGDLLLSAVAVNELNNLTVSRFRNYIRHLGLKQGLIHHSIVRANTVFVPAVFSSIIAHQTTQRRAPRRFCPPDRSSIPR